MIEFIEHACLQNLESKRIKLNVTSDCDVDEKIIKNSDFNRILHFSLFGYLS